MEVYCWKRNVRNAPSGCWVLFPWSPQLWLIIEYMCPLCAAWAKCLLSAVTKSVKLKTSSNCCNSARFKSVFDADQVRMSKRTASSVNTLLWKVTSNARRLMSENLANINNVSFNREILNVKRRSKLTYWTLVGRIQENSLLFKWASSM